MNKKERAEGLPAKDIFKKKSDSSIIGGDKKPVPTIPTDKEFAEAHTPELSQDIFVIANKTFKLRMSSIKTQKIMARALDAITDLIKKIDLLPIFRGIQDKLNRNQSALIAKVKKAVDSEEDIDLTDDSDNYLDMVELIKDVISHGGLSNIMNTILDIYVGVVFAICNSQDETVSRDWVEENISFYDAQKIFFIQMEKDRIGGRIIDFLHILTLQIVSEEEKTI